MTIAKTRVMLQHRRLYFYRYYEHFLFSHPSEMLDSSQEQNAFIVGMSILNSQYQLYYCLELIETSKKWNEKIFGNKWVLFSTPRMDLYFCQFFALLALTLNQMYFVFVKLEENKEIKHEFCLRLNKLSTIYKEIRTMDKSFPSLIKDW